MMNPFSPMHPANPQDFVNREEVIRAFGRSLERTAASKPRRPDNIAILGDWGVGKTSVLMKFEELALNGLKDINAFAAFIELTPSTSVNFTQFAVRTRDEIERSFKVSTGCNITKNQTEFLQ